MKTFGILTAPHPTWGAYSRQVRVIVATTSQAKAVAALHQVGLQNMTVNHLRHYGGQTYNDVETTVAEAKPGTVFWAEDHGTRMLDDYHEAEVRP